MLSPSIMETALEKYKQSRIYSDERPRSSKESREMYKSGYSSRRTQRRPENRNTRRRKEIPEDQCISLLPSAKSNSKENISENKTPEFSRNKWIKSENSKHPLSNKMHQQNELDLSKEFPPLGISSYTPEVTKDWGSIVDEEEEARKTETKNRTNYRFKRRLLLSEAQEENVQPPKPSKPVLTDAHKLLQRQKQVDIGKNTLSYGRFIAAVPRDQRTKEDPNTPDKFQVCSTRSWVGQIKNWRRKLHVWDPPSEGQEELFSNSSQSSVQSFPCEVKMEVDSNCDADDDMMSSSTPSSVDDLFGDFDIDACLMNDGLPL
ncbi:hypothetical protein ACROYT_G006315 [Oculina patagonica]